MENDKKLKKKKFNAFGILHSVFFSSKKRIALFILVFGIAAFFIWRGFSAQSQQVQYQTEAAARGTLISSITSSGTVSSGNNVDITTQATGIVTAVYVKNGDYVNQGDKIADITLDTSSKQKQQSSYASYLSAQNSLNSAKNQMNSLQAAMFEANQTFVKGAGTADPVTDDPTYIIQKANWLKAETDYTSQQNVIAAAQASLASAWLSYSQISPTVTAPSSGYISNLNISTGVPIVGSSTTSNSTSSTSNSTSTQTIGTISLKDSSLTATVNLTEIDIVKVKIGQKVTMTLDAFGDTTFTGKVTAIDTTGTVSSGVTTYPATITFDTTPDKVYPNMAVNATIITNIKPDVLLVPAGAVQTQNGSSYVRLLKNNQPVLTSVEVGDSSDTQTEIISGIKEGDFVITGSSTQSTSTSQSSSPFGSLGGNRSFGGGTRIQR